MGHAPIFLAGVGLGGFIAWTFACRAAARRDRRCGRMLSFVNHELNTPATAVGMAVVNLLSGIFGELSADQRKWLELTQNQLGRLNSLVGESRDFVHLELLRDLRPVLAPAAPAMIIDAALSCMRCGFEHSGVELLAAVPEGLPRVRADAERLARSLASLLCHARKFRLCGPVRLSAAVDGPVVSFEIDYMGQVLSPAEIAASLDLWYPARARKDQLLAASGLGLGFARRLTRLCGGEMEFASDDKGRARLRLTAPVYGEA